MPRFTARDALRWALQIETNGCAFYTDVAGRMSDGDARLLFTDLAQQESRHYRTFLRLLERAPSEPAAPLEEQRHTERLLQALYANALLGDDGGMVLAAQATDESLALRAAIAFEKDTILFFMEIQHEAAPAAADTLGAIIDEEREHLRQLVHVLHDLPWVP